MKQGLSLASAAYNLVQGGFSAAKINDAKALIGGAKTFFAALHHRPDAEVNEDGLGEENFVEDWKGEGKDVWMFSGCADDQTSADTSIAGAPTGAMSYGFIKTMKENPDQSYIQVCCAEWFAMDGADSTRFFRIPGRRWRSIINRSRSCLWEDCMI